MTVVSRDQGTLSEMSGIDQRCQRVRPVRPCDLLFGNLMITSGGGGGGGGGIIPLVLVTPYINLLRDENTDGLTQIIY